MATILIHGGAGTIEEGDRQAYETGLRAARDAGFAALSAGADALSAALAAITLMEDNADAFNAGTGGSPNRDGVVECDTPSGPDGDEAGDSEGARTRGSSQRPTEPITSQHRRLHLGC